MKKISRIVLIVLFCSTVIFSQTDVTAPNVPSNFRGISYELHIDLLWDENVENDMSGYNLYKWDGTNYLLYTFIPKGKNYISLFNGSLNVAGKFKLTAKDNAGNESGYTDSVETLTREMNNEEFLDMVQRATFRYFWDYADPASGLARERFPDDPTCAIGGSGFGVMAIPVGIERGFISREMGVDRMLKILDFLLNKADLFHGAFPHWINGNTGRVVPFGSNDDGGDIVETSFMIQGLLTNRQYFDRNDDKEIQIRSMINQIWERVEWDWYRRSQYSDYLYWNWSPNYQWDINLKLQGWNETLITYLLATSSPTHNVPADLYYKGFAGSSNYKNYNSYYGYRLYVGKSYGGPLFFTHYSFLGFDPRGYKDKYANYFEHNRNAALIHREYAIQNTRNYNGYGKDCWGITASYSIPGVGYTAHEPVFNDNGTISPTAALSSMPYTPEESIEVIKHLYRTYKNKLWWDYGFKDAFNLTYSSKGINGEWFSNGYLAIDQGPIIVMIENYRTGLLWKNFMKNPEIEPALFSMGFLADTLTSLNENTDLPKNFRLNDNYPNPFNPTTTIGYTIPAGKNGPSNLTSLKVFNVLGQEIITLVDSIQKPGNYSVKFDASDLNSGIYIYRLTSDGFSDCKKMVLVK